jgi:hypothetical protein
MASINCLKRNQVTCGKKEAGSWKFLLLRFIPPPFKIKV